MAWRNSIHDTAAFALLPYCGKLIAFLLLRARFESIWSQPALQAVRLSAIFLTYRSL